MEVRQNAEKSPWVGAGFDFNGGEGLTRRFLGVLRQPKNIFC